MKISEILEKTKSLTLNMELSHENWQNIRINKISELTSAGPSDMVLISKPEHIEQLEKTEIQTVVYLPKIKSLLPQSKKRVFLEAKQFSRVLAELLPSFLPREESFTSSPTSIHPTAKIGKNVTFGPFVVVGAHASIEDNVTLGPHVVIGANAQIGSGSRMIAHNFVGARCSVGKNCLFHSHTSLGPDGYGFWTNPEGQHIKVPQVGNVVVEDDVELGAFVAVDRATLGTTYIRKGTKLDNFCHIAHNCDIGEHSLGSGGFMTAGSCKIGHHFTAGGGTHIGDHVTIVPNVTLAGRTGVTSNIDEPGIYGGYPIQPLKDYLKSMSNYKHLTAMRKSIDQILKHLGLEIS